jgi:hypothetical protein
MVSAQSPEKAQGNNPWTHELLAIQREEEEIHEALGQTLPSLLQLQQETLIAFESLQ